MDAVSFDNLATVAAVAFVAPLRLGLAPALLYGGLLGGRQALAAGLLQSTTLSFVLIASQIGQELGLLGPRTSRR